VDEGIKNVRFSTENLPETTLSYKVYLRNSKR